MAGQLNVQNDKLKQLYSAIELKTKRLEQVHQTRLNCRKGCSGCCVDEITVWNVEAENIRLTHPALLSDELPNTKGGCAFLASNGACRIYHSRPYVCRTQGLPLRWFDEIEDEIYEFRDICPLNEDVGDEPIENLAEHDCWTIGDAEAALADLQREFENGEMRRVPLRELFTSKIENPALKATNTTDNRASKR